MQISSKGTKFTSPLFSPEFKKSFVLIVKKINQRAKFSGREQVAMPHFASLTGGEGIIVYEGHIQHSTELPMNIVLLKYDGFKFSTRTDM
jgi:hypothetical protein